MRPDPAPPAAPGLAEILRQVRRIELRSRRLVDSHFSGEYHSVFKGSGLEFAEVRPYLPGDDVRTIDWNVSARTGQPHVKQYVEERELAVLLLVDVSASQRFGTRQRFRSELAAEVAAVLALSASRNNDRVGLLAVSDRVERFLPPKKGRRNALRLIRDLLALRPVGRGTDLALGLEYAFRVLRSRSVVFLLSDFQVGAGWPGFQRALTAAAHRHDVVVLRLTDPGDEALPDAGVLALADPETGQVRYLDTGRRATRERFAAEAAAARERLRTLLRRLGVDEVELPAGVPYAPALLGFFRRRERLLRR